MLALDSSSVYLESPCRCFFTWVFLFETYLLSIDAHLVHLLYQFVWHFICERHVDLLALPLLEYSFRVLELSDRLSLSVMARRYSHYVQERVEHCLSKASVGLAVIHQHLLDHFLCRRAAETTRLGPRLIDVAISGHPIDRQ